jgi:hypothetical protein
MAEAGGKRTFLLGSRDGHIETITLSRRLSNSTATFDGGNERMTDWIRLRASTACLVRQLEL